MGWVCANCSSNNSDDAKICAVCDAAKPIFDSSSMKKCSDATSLHKLDASNAARMNKKETTKDTSGRSIPYSGVPGCKKEMPSKHSYPSSSTSSHKSSSLFTPSVSSAPISSTRPYTPPRSTASAASSGARIPARDTEDLNGFDSRLSMFWLRASLILPLVLLVISWFGVNVSIPMYVYVGAALPALSVSVVYKLIKNSKYKKFVAITLPLLLICGAAYVFMLTGSANAKMLCLFLGFVLCMIESVIAVMMLINRKKYDIPMMIAVFAVTVAMTALAYIA